MTRWDRERLVGALLWWVFAGALCGLAWWLILSRR